MELKSLCENILCRVLVLLVMIPAAGLAQGSQEHERLIDALQAKYNRLNTLAAGFTQIHNAPGERMRRETGQLLLKKPGRMRWDYSGTESKLYLSDGRFVYEYVPADGYATRMSLKEADDWRAPFAFLLGRGNLRQDFKRIEVDAEAPTRAGNRVLRMTPKREQEFRVLLVEVDPASLQLVRLSFVDRQGARSDFLFSDIRENVAAAETRFTPPAGVEIRKN
jgi:outer membrane lipoprotein carrier protein